MINLTRIPLATINFLSKNNLYVFSALLALSLLPFVVMQDKLHVIIHDSLDCLVPWMVVVAREGKMFAYDSTVNQIMNGIPRACFPSGLNMTAILFTVFPPFIAYLFNHIIVHVVAFLGMRRLLKTHITPKTPVISSGVAFCFSILPFYSMFGLSIAGQPLLVSAILNITSKKNHLRDWIIILLFPMCSSFVYVGIFILTVLSAWLFFDLLRTKRINTSLLIGILMLTSSYCLVEYHLIRDILFGGNYVSHRVEYSTYALQESYGLLEVAKVSVRNFLLGQYHAASLHTASLFLAIPLALFFAMNRKDRGRFWIMSGILALCFLFSIMLGIQGWRLLIPIEEKIPILYQFQFGRFHWLHPVLWFILIALALDTIWFSHLKIFGDGKFLVILLLAVQCAFTMGFNEEFSSNCKNFVKQFLFNSPHRMSHSYAEYYSTDLFNKVAQHIGKPKSEYRVASLGIDPTIAAYNGFFTLDFYAGNYPLRYKHQFREIIEKELDKDEKLRRYFDGWGNRCYLFADSNFDINLKAFSNMGGKYIFSAVRINNHTEKGLALEGTFEDKSSPWKIWVYRPKNGVTTQTAK